MVKKKLAIIESDEGLPEGFVTQNLLKNPEEEKCGISDLDLENLKKNQAMPKDTDFFVDPNLTSECFSPDWICFPEYPFSIGLKFPFPNLITQFFASTKLNYAQVMPQVWRILQTLIRLGEETGLKVGLEELAYSTELRGFGLGRYCLRVKKGESILIPNVDSADRGWKNKFFFARKASLGQVAGVNSKWRSQEVAKLSVLFPEKTETQENVKKILGLEESIRAFQPYPVQFPVEGVEERIEEEGSKPEEEEESNLPSSVKMSTATRSKATVSASDLLANAKAVRAVKKEKKPPTPKSVVSSSKASSVKKEESKKRKLMEVETLEIIEAPMKVEKVKENFGKLVKDFFDKGSEMMTFIMEQLVSRDEQIETLKRKAAKDSYDAEEARKKARVSANLTLKREIETLCTERVKESNAHLEELEAARKDFEFNATKTLLEGRIQLMEEFKNGIAPTWDLEEEKKTLESFVGEPLDGEEVNSPVLDAALIPGEEINKVLSTVVVTQVVEGNQVDGTSETPAALGQDAV